MILSKTFDRAIDAGLFWISPRRAALRRHLRRMDGDFEYRETFLALMRARGYRAAGKSGSKSPWTSGSRSADAEILNDLPALRNRSRELNRDDSIGSSIVNTFVSNVIGRGMQAQARTGDLGKDTRLESVWNERKNDLSQADDLSHGATQRLIFRRVLEDGDVLRKAVYSENDEPVWFETVEAERLATPGDKSADGNIRDGVERDGLGRPVRYWISKGHPGDTVAGVSFKQTKDFDPLDRPYVRHLKKTDRPGQTRGVPFFHAILQDIRDLDLLIIAALKRNQIAACLSAFITTPYPIADIMPVTAQKYGYQLDQDLEPGMIWKLYPGETVQTLIPNFPVPELKPFVIMLAQRIGTAIGISWQIVLNDFSDSNYSSARANLLEARMTYTIWQSWFIESYLNWEWFIVLEDARLRGDARLADMTDDDLRAVRWIPNGWRWVDPVKEAEGAEIELMMGITTLRELCASQGRDWEEVQDQRLLEELREREKRAELGLPEKVAQESSRRSRPVAVVDDNDDENENEKEETGNGRGFNGKRLRARFT